MRITFVLMVLACVFSKAQDAPKAALTAGSESLVIQSENPSLTSNQTITTESYVSPEASVTQVRQARMKPKVEESPFNFMALLVAFILSGIAVYFIRTKINNQNNSTIPYETEEEIELKKEVWEKLASETSEENEANK